MARTGVTKKKPVPSTEVETDPAWKKAIKPLVIGALVVGGVVALVLLDPPLPGEEYPSQGNAHVVQGEAHEPYNSKPGSSGPHYDGLAGWVVHEQPVPNELFIHNLEDRGVVFVYNCPDGCPELSDGLADLWDELGGNLLVTPYEGEIAGQDGTRYRAAALAWGRIYFFDDLDESTIGEIKAFYRAFHGINHHPGT